MADPSYVHEVIWNAANCLFGGEGTFEERFVRASVPGLIALKGGDDCRAEYAEELNTVLMYCRKYIHDGHCTSAIPDGERRLIERHLWYVLKQLEGMIDRD